MIDLLSLKQNIKTEALRLGFNHLGIAAANPVPHFDPYKTWIEQENHGEMAYLARPDAVAKRADPGLILEGCTRVISLALPYNPPETGFDVPTLGKGRISAYARTVDYHTVIWEKLAQLEDFIRAHADVPVATRSYVDTGPVLERSFAVQSGIGMIGKNGCLIVQGTGSYFFLAEILTDLALPVDAPNTRDLCGSCTRCIDACPTNCILPNHTIDARRCISYLTIEYRGAIPDELKSRMGNWLFGCDVCQMVCPHNATTPKQMLPLGSPRLPEFLTLVDLLILDEAAFARQFGHTPLSRTKRQGLLRNAAVLLGNQGDPASLPGLRQALTRETDPGLLDALHWAIRQIEAQQETAVQ